MKVLYITYFYPPEEGAGAVRAYYNVAALRSRGHEVLVLAPLPNYPKGEVFLPWRGCLYHFDESERVLRVYIKPSVSPKPWARVVPYAGFDLAGTIASLVMRFLSGFDVIVATSPPLPGVAFAAVMSLMMRVPLVMDFRDIWPDLGIRMGTLRPDALETRLTAALERFVLKAAKTCVVTAEGDRENLIAKGVPSRKIELIPNGADTELFNPSRALKRSKRLALYGGAKGFAVIYAGSFNFGMNDIELLADLAGIVSAKKQFTLYLVGDGRGRSFIESAISAESQHVRLLPPMPHRELAPLMASCDAGLVPLKDRPDTGGNIPVKMFEYWACGLPVLLGARNDSHTLPIFEEIGAGVRFPAGDAQAAFEAVLKLKAMSVRDRRNLGAMGRSFVEQNYSRRAWAMRFAEVVEQTAA